jgi:3-hydroxy-3-methylglutaryl CoA synthase
MKTVFEHIEHIKGKPHHIRKQVAFAVAAGTSGLIAFVWLAANLATGSFAIQGSDFAMSASRGDTIATTTSAVAEGLAGVGAAAFLQKENAPAHVEIVDTSVAQPAKTQPEQTTIPF